MDIKYNAHGLVPVVTQDYYTGEVLMLAYMNETSLNLTIETKIMHYFSRSRNELWKKGETSGNIQEVKSLSYDCDGDTILAKVKQTGVACHTGNKTCFFNPILEDIEKKKSFNILADIYKTIEDRDKNPKEGSYTNYLLEKGIDKILKKVGEEATESVIAAKNNDKEEITNEVSDLLYHLSVMLYDRKITWEEVFKILEDRA